MACGLTDPVGCVTDVVGGATKSVADAAFSAIASDFGQAADSVVNWLWRQISAATAVSLTGRGLSAELSITAAIAVTVGVGLFVIQVIASVLRREPGGLVRAGRGLLVAFVAGGASIAVVNLLLAAVDALSTSVVQAATGGNIQQVGAKLIAPAALTQIPNAAVTILLALVMVAACVVVWAALMIRKLLIVVAAVFAPIAFAGSLSDITTAWVRRWIETMVALVFSKLVLVIIFAIGLGVMGGGAGQSNQSAAGGTTQSLTQTVSGALILVMAGLSPWMAIKLVHFAGDAFHTVHGQAASTAVGAQRLVSAPKKMSALGSPSKSGGSALKPGSPVRPGTGAGLGQTSAGKPPSPVPIGASGPASGIAGGSTAAAGAGTVASAGVAVPAALAVAATKAASSAAGRAAQQSAEALSEPSAPPPSRPPKASDPARPPTGSEP